MTDLIATLSAEGAANWEICKREGLWGTGARNNHSKHAVSRTEIGDRVFVWQSRTGLIALARVVGRPYAFGSNRLAPWPDADNYVFGVPIELVEELDEPIPDSFEEHRSRRFGVQTHQVQSGYAVLKPDQAEALMGAFTPANREGPAEAAVTPPSATRPALGAVYLNRPGSDGGSGYLIPTPSGSACWAA